jgi:type IV pilus assembly protein PilB
MSDPQKKPALSGLAKKLVQVGLLTEDVAVNAIEQSTRDKLSLVYFLVNKNLVNAQALATTAALEFGLPLFRLDAWDSASSPRDLVKPELIRKHRILPLAKRGNHLFVAISDPTNEEGLDDIRHHIGINIEPIIVEDDKLSDCIEKVLNQQETSSLSSMGDDELKNLDISSDDDSLQAQSATDAEDAPIVKFVNKMLLDAINLGASDIHFEPYEKDYRIRYRQDGILREASHPPVNLSHRLSARLKVMARLDISERRVPQDGRVKMRISANRAIDFRVSTCPTLYGEKVVLRILDPASAKLGIDALGYEEFQKELFLKAIHKPQGMVLVTGPTGSGKTVSLYTAEINISTCEDPVEINLSGINQLNVNPRAGLTFAVALRSFLRQDPDVIMVGEIRDLETAEIAVKAAQTGHMVLSTLHTNSAAESLTRLINMGVPSYNLATSVSLVIAQRLARKLCTHCKEPIKIPKPALLEAGFQEDELDSLNIFAAIGCGKCTDGYKGRLGIYEVMPVTPQIAQIIMAGGDAIGIAAQAAKEGIWNLRQAGLNKLKQGLTTLEEINRVTKD